MEQFNQEYLCKFWNNPKEFYLSEMADLYHERTESFDRLVCSGPIVKGAIVPVTSEQKTLINNNAKQVYEELYLLVAIMGFDHKDWHQAIIKSNKNG